MTKPKTTTKINHDQEITKLRLILRKLDLLQEKEQTETNQPITIEDLDGNETTIIYQITNKWRFTTNKIGIKESIKRLINTIRKERNEKRIKEKKRKNK